jgi:hypothetical protein
MGWDCVSQRPPPASLLFIPQVIYKSEQPRWNDTDSGNHNNSEKTCPIATLSTTNPTVKDADAYPGLRCERPATNRLSHGTANIQHYGDCLPHHALTYDKLCRHWAGHRGIGDHLFPSVWLIFGEWEPGLRDVRWISTYKYSVCYWGKLKIGHLYNKYAFYNLGPAIWLKKLMDLPTELWTNIEA